jgi:hypothetical protein
MRDYRETLQRGSSVWSAMRDYRETLQGGSSVWQCNERLQGDIAARQFSVTVQRDRTGRHYSEAVQCGSAMRDCRETLQRGSSVWQCNERLTGRHCSEAVQCCCAVRQNMETLQRGSSVWQCREIVKFGIQILLQWLFTNKVTPQRKTRKMFRISKEMYCPYVHILLLFKTYVDISVGPDFPDIIFNLISNFALLIEMITLLHILVLSLLWCTKINFTSY